MMRTYWSMHSSNPVRRGVRLAESLGCFSCHGMQGREGIPDPAKDDDTVPAWSGGVWMMYVHSDEEIRNMIRTGKKDESSHDDHHDHEIHGIEMPAYGDRINEDELDDLVAAFRVLSRMAPPPENSSARRGYDLSRKWQCETCHGAGASGGLPNPGSFTGFIPGWYGADFLDLVRSREEFNEWIREGELRRLTEHAIASRFIRRQKIRMPAYEDLTDIDLDDLWSYTEWLAETRGGIDAEIRAAW
jgi:mono/diheme cytochrome c family protein